MRFRKKKIRYLNKTFQTLNLHEQSALSTYRKLAMIFFVKGRI
jgi:hypothetical protein